MKIVFAGSPEIAASALREVSKHHEIVMVLTMPDSPVGRKRILTPTPVAQEAERLKIPIIKTKRIGPNEQTQLESSGAELAVVLAYGALLPASALQLFPWLNLHFSTLPNWRGATPLQHSMISGVGQGFTIFQIDEGMDTGPVLHVEPLELPEDQSCGKLLQVLTTQGTDKLLELLQTELIARPQSGAATLAPKIGRHEARLDFSKTSDELQRFVMALNPEPMAWAESGGQAIRILQAKSLGATNWDALADVPSDFGQIELSGDRPLVVCGQGTRLELIEVQPAGKRAMSASDWVRGHGKGLRLD